MLSDKPHYGKINSSLWCMLNITLYSAQRPVQRSQITQLRVRYIHNAVPHACFTLQRYPIPPSNWSY